VTEDHDLPAAVAGIEAWLASVRDAGAFTGPTVGLRGTNVLYTGPAWDWRLEGIFAGRARRFAKTRDPEHLALLNEEVASLAAAQFACGSFRCSWFDSNPCEGGMPHEPAALAALCRAADDVASAGGRIETDVDTVVARHVDEFLLKRLWDRARRTFRDWEISDFESHNAASVAAAIDLLDAHGRRTGRAGAFAEHVRDAAASLLALQQPRGPAAGGIATSSRRGEGRSPFLTSRCIHALEIAARVTGESRFEAAAALATDFVASAQLPAGGFRRMCSASGEWADGPLFLGPTAGTLVALMRAGRTGAIDAERHTRFLLAHRQPTGAFRNALGIGAPLATEARPDWRDWIPSAGWLDKIFDWLTSRPGGADAPESTAHGQVARDASVLGRPARYEEDASTIRIIGAGGGAPLYLWHKRRPAPQVCELPS